MRRREDGRHLWAEDHETGPDAEPARSPAEATAKQRAVLGMQGKVGNGAVSRSVQRFSWGDPSDWFTMLGPGAAKKAAATAVPKLHSAEQVTKVDVRAWEPGKQKEIVGQSKSSSSGLGSKQGLGSTAAEALWADKSPGTSSKKSTDEKKDDDD